MSCLPTELSLFNYDRVKSVLHSITPLIKYLVKCTILVIPLQCLKKYFAEEFNTSAYNFQSLYHEGDAHIADVFLQ